MEERLVSPVNGRLLLICNVGTRPLKLLGKTLKAPSPRERSFPGGEVSSTLLTNEKFLPAQQVLELVRSRQVRVLVVPSYKPERLPILIRQRQSSIMSVQELQSLAREAEPNQVLPESVSFDDPPDSEESHEGLTSMSFEGSTPSDDVEESSVSFEGEEGEEEMETSPSDPVPTSDTSDLLLHRPDLEAQEAPEEPENSSDAPAPEAQEEAAPQEGDSPDVPSLLSEEEIALLSGDLADVSMQTLRDLGARFEPPVRGIAKAVLAVDILARL